MRDIFQKPEVPHASPELSAMVLEERRPQIMQAIMNVDIATEGIPDNGQSV